MLAAVQADPALRKAVDAAAVKRVFDPQVALAAARRQFDERLPALRAA